MFIRSERLFLRPPFAEDWQEVHAAICDKAVVDMLAQVPWPYCESDARTFVARPRDPLLPVCLITLPEFAGAPVIGCIGLDRRADGVELGYWIARSHWGRGYATEAGRALLASAKVLGHRRIKAGHALDNAASRRVLEKLGFRPTGEIRVQASMARQGEAMKSRRYVLGPGVPADNDCDRSISAAA